MCVHAAVTDGTAQRTRCNAAQHVPSTTAHSLLGNGAQRVLSNAARGVLSNAASCVIPHTPHDSGKLYANDLFRAFTYR